MSFASRPMEAPPRKGSRTLGQWLELLRQQGPATRRERITWLKAEHGLSSANATELVDRLESLLRSDESIEALIDGQYTDRKAALRPVADKVVEMARGLGDDVQVEPRRADVVLRRGERPFAVLWPATDREVDMGLLLQGGQAGPRLKAGGRLVPDVPTTHKVALTGLDDVDAELEGWLRSAYDRAVTIGQDVMSK